MNDDTIAFLIYTSVLLILLVIAGFVSKRSDYDSDEKLGAIVGCLAWPLMIFIIPAGYVLVKTYNFGVWLVGRYHD